MAEYVVELSLEILSPCFLGGAHQQPEFRVASLRGLWRYWYRALYGRGDESKGPVEGEVELFGDTTRRGAARLVARAGGTTLPTAEWRRGAEQTGADYLLFTMDMNRRRYLEPGAKMPLELHVKGTAAEFERAARSLAVALSFGGIGARSRRMAGATHLVATRGSGLPDPLVPVAPAVDAGALAARLRELIAPALDRSVGRPRFHVVARQYFAAGALERAFPNWRAALDAVGSYMRRFRSRREPDYGLAREVLGGQGPTPGRTVTRAAFGLPITFRFRSLGGSSVTVQLPDSDRRGSPLFLTLERIEGGLAVLWCLFRGPLSPDGQLRLKPGPRLEAPGLELVEEMLAGPEWRSHRIAE